MDWNYIFNLIDQCFTKFERSAPHLFMFLFAIYCAYDCIMKLQDFQVV